MKSSESLLIILPACVNIGRALASGFCHNPKMASIKPIQPAKAPVARPRPVDHGANLTLVPSASKPLTAVSDASPKPSPRRLVVDAQNISLTFE
ncbi:hypothetical protein, partial [Bradyrhizobium sp.]|uniref:hypothetical protein n=1 Tax=Bradyrhizobium sp. TaxID=376 RepID=UPI003C3DCCA1